MPMDPERLADRDHWEVEATRWRARCPVAAEDVERAEVTWAHVTAWLEANGWARPTDGRFGLPHDAGGPFVHWARRRTGWVAADVVCVYAENYAPGIARAVAAVARHHERVGHDILDEMAAIRIEVGS